MNTEEFDSILDYAKFPSMSQMFFCFFLSNVPKKIVIKYTKSFLLKPVLLPHSHGNISSASIVCTQYKYKCLVKSVNRNGPFASHNTMSFFQIFARAFVSLDNK